MDATLVLIDSDAELLRARALVDQLTDPADVARLEAQASLIAAYEEKGPRRPPGVADLIRHLMDQHGRASPGWNWSSITRCLAGASVTAEVTPGPACVLQ